MKRKSKRNINYNKFFSYNCAERQNRNFYYKDFSYSNSYNTHFTRSLFYGNNFFKARMKYCSFNGCKFTFIEFRNTNFRGCSFKGAQFENVIFINCNLSNTSFHDATFKNVYYYNTSLKNTKGIKNECTLKKINNNLNLTLIPELEDAIELCKNNRYIIDSNTIFYTKKRRLSNAQKAKDKLLPKQERKLLQRERQKELLKSPKQIFLCKINIIRLSYYFTQNEIAKGLILASKQINKNFSSLSYFIPFIKKASS